jgi:hypothetical protein
VKVTASEVWREIEPSAVFMFVTAVFSNMAWCPSGYMEFVVDRMPMGQVFSEYFSFPCQFSFHRLLHTHNHLSSKANIMSHNGWHTKWSQAHSTLNLEKS